MDNNNSSTTINSRERIARIISISVPVATGVLAVLAIVFAGILIHTQNKKEAIDILKYTFTALLPLWGTWIGTVLAYYFSKENFESANENVRKLVTHVSAVNEKLKRIKAKDVMIPASKIVKQDFESEATLIACKIADIISFIKASDQNRLPLFVNKSLKYILHLSTFDRFIRLMLEEKKDYQTLTINDMITCNDDMIKNTLLKGASFISEQANLLEAKNIMDANKYCNDVFVTPAGHPSEEVLGWITDKTVNANATV